MRFHKGHSWVLYIWFLYESVFSRLITNHHWQGPMHLSERISPILLLRSSTHSRLSSRMHLRGTLCLHGLRLISDWPEQLWLMRGKPPTIKSTAGVFNISYSLQVYKILQRFWQTKMDVYLHGICDRPNTNGCNAVPLYKDSKPRKERESIYRRKGRVLTVYDSTIK
jgi:hypothetical protein